MHGLILYDRALLPVLTTSPGPAAHCEELSRIFNGSPRLLLRFVMRGWVACRLLGIDVWNIADRQAVGQHDAVMADQELTDAGLVVACAGFDDCHGPVDRALLFDIAEQHYVLKQKDERRNRYQIQVHLPLPEPASRGRTLGEALGLLAGASAR